VLASAWERAVRLYRTLLDAVSRIIQLNASFQDELQPTPRRLAWLNVCFIVLTIGTTALVFEEGLSQNMHLVSPNTVDMLAQTTAIDLSQRFHGTTGYIGRTEVLQTLFRAGFTSRQFYLDKLGIQYPANAETGLISRAIQDALTLKDLPANPTFGNRQLFAPEANDPGFVDYVSWSFDIFGFRVEALYYFYFVILSTSITFYLICFRADALPLLVLSAVMVSFLTLLNSQLFTNEHLRTVYNQRFLGSLCVVPYLHLLFTLLIYRKPTLSRVLVTVLQAALFTLVMFTRSSAFWMILSLALIIGLNVMFRFGRPQTERKATQAAKFVLSWPIVLVVGGFLCSFGYKSATLHPIYGIGIFLPYHMVWHNAYMGLALHPDWNERGDQHGKPILETVTDNMAWIAAAAEANERYGLPGEYLNNTELGGLPGIKIGLHEKLIKERFLRFAYQHPLFMLELYLWYKPKIFFSELAWAFSNYSWKVGTLLCQIIFVVGAAMAWGRLEIPSAVQGVLSRAVLATGMMSLLPAIWTYPMAHIVAEQFFIWIAILLYFATLLLSKAWSSGRVRIRSSRSLT
jgi:hypothetical protein